MMYEAPEWNPHSLSFIRQEEAMTDSFGRVQDPDQLSRFHDRQAQRGIWIVANPSIAQ